MELDRPVMLGLALNRNARRQLCRRFMKTSSLTPSSLQRLSYDDCQEIRELYSWASFQELEIRYTNAVTDKKRPKNRELLISPQDVAHGQ